MLMDTFLVDAFIDPITALVLIILPTHERPDDSLDNSNTNDLGSVALLRSRVS